MDEWCGGIAEANNGDSDSDSSVGDGDGALVLQLVHKMLGSTSHSGTRQGRQGDQRVHDIQYCTYITYTSDLSEASRVRPKSRITPYKSRWGAGSAAGDTGQNIHIPYCM